MLSRVILAPSSDTPAIRPALVSTKACTGAVAVDVSILPFALSFTTATVASAPTAQRAFAVLTTDPETGLNDRREDQHAARFGDELARAVGGGGGVQARERR